MYCHDLDIMVQTQVGSNLGCVVHLSKSYLNQSNSNDITDLKVHAEHVTVFLHDIFHYILSGQCTN